MGATVSLCCAVHGDELVVASGRPPKFARRTAALRFTRSREDERWHEGAWRQLGRLRRARVGAALVEVAGRLYITGGVDEGSGEFFTDAERLEGDEWEPVPWFRMPRALHAHACLALPRLAS